VVGDRSYRLQVNFAHDDPAPLYADAVAPAVLSDSSGNNITQKVTGGKLGALLKFRNETVSHYLGDTQHTGELNRLATQMASRINTILAAGYPPLEDPVQLFVLGNSPVAVAHAIKVNPAMLPGMLRATDVYAVPPIVNGNAQKLAQLARPSDPADMLDGLSYIGYFGKISSHAGRELANARLEAQSRGLMAVQARNMREEISGVSLDEEAIRLVEYQRAYQASARMVTVLDELIEMAVNIGRV
jgi:flagellar hook-associated protein 1 FlgK